MIQNVIAAAVQDATQTATRGAQESAADFLPHTIKGEHLSISNDITMADIDRPASPSPEDRKRLDAEAKQKEDEEQSKLPYKWVQTIGDLDLTATIPANIKGRDLDVKLTRNGVKAGIKGQEPIIDVYPPFTIP